MTAVSVSDTAATRRIGEILLAHGAVSEEALAEAAAEQERTAQPLGQILVQRGAITRLELASALAEQWSDPRTSISLVPLPAPGRPPAPQPHDDAQYAARLQDAVADLARRVQSSQPLEAIDERVTNVSQRIEATLARTHHIEAAVATLAESLEGVTGGVEEAIVELRAGTASLAADLARIETLVDETALDDLRGALSELEGRPTRDPEVEVRLDRLEALATDDTMRTELEGQAAMLADMRATLTELEACPAGSLEADARLARIETQLAKRAASAAGTAAVEALTVRVEAADELQEGLVTSIEALGVRVDEIAGSDERDTVVATRLDGLEARVEAEAEAVANLHEAVSARIDSVIDGRLEGLNVALDVIRGDVTAFANLTPTDPLLADQVESLVERVQQLTVPPTPDLEVAQQIEELAARVERLTAGRADHDSLVAKLEAIETRRVSDLDTIDVLARALDRIRHDLTSAPASPPSDPSAIDEAVARLDERLRALGGIETRVEELAKTIEAAVPVGFVQAPDEFSHDTNLRIDALARTLDERLAAISAPASPATEQPAGIEDELERVRMAVERVGLHLGEHDRALAELMGSHEISDRLDELASRIDEVAAAGTGGGPSIGSGLLAGDMPNDLRAFMQRVDETELASQNDREKLISRLKRMASSIEGRLQRLEIDEPD